MLPLTEPCNISIIWNCRQKTGLHIWPSVCLCVRESIVYKMNIALNISSVVRWCVSPQAYIRTTRLFGHEMVLIQKSISAQMKINGFANAIYLDFMGFFFSLHIYSIVPFNANPSDCTVCFPHFYFIVQFGTHRMTILFDFHLAYILLSGSDSS